MIFECTETARKNQQVVVVVLSDSASRVVLKEVFCHNTVDMVYAGDRVVLEPRPVTPGPRNEDLTHNIVAVTPLHTDEDDEDSSDLSD